MSGRVSVAELLPSVLRASALRSAIRAERPSEFPAISPVRCLKCDGLTTRRLDSDVGIHEECER